MITESDLAGLQVNTIPWLRVKKSAFNKGSTMNEWLCVAFSHVFVAAVCRAGETALRLLHIEDLLSDLSLL